MKKSIFLALLCMLLLTVSAFAQTVESPLQTTEPPVKTKFLMELNGEFGGDELATIFFTNGEE